MTITPSQVAEALVPPRTITSGACQYFETRERQTGILDNFHAPKYMTIWKHKKQPFNYFPSSLNFWCMGSQELTSKEVCLSGWFSTSGPIFVKAPNNSKSGNKIRNWRISHWPVGQCFDEFLVGVFLLLRILPFRYELSLVIDCFVYPIGMRFK